MSLWKSGDRTAGQVGGRKLRPSGASLRALPRPRPRLSLSLGYPGRWCAQGPSCSDTLWSCAFTRSFVRPPKHCSSTHCVPGLWQGWDATANKLDVALRSNRCPPRGREQHRHPGTEARAAPGHPSAERMWGSPAERQRTRRKGGETEGGRAGPLEGGDASLTKECVWWCVRMCVCECECSGKH